MLVPFRALQTKDQELNRVQAHLKPLVSQLIDLPILNGTLLENVAIATTDTLVEHKLGRSYRGWIVVDKNADSRVWSTALSPADLSSRYVQLKASSAVTVSLWVF